MIKYFQLQKDNILFFILMPVGFNFGLFVFRVVFTGSIYYAFLVWNLFLAFLPLLISTFLVQKKNKNWIYYLFPCILWLLLLPNAPYIITDFIHLEETNTIPLWFDLMLILSYAWNGLMFWLISILQFNNIIKNRLRPIHQKTLIQLIIFLCAIGVYLGRYGRWNSWDVFIDPFEIVEKVIYMTLHPKDFPGFYGMTISIYVFLSLLFSFIKRITNYPIPKSFTQTFDQANTTNLY